MTSHSAYKRKTHCAEVNALGFALPNLAMLTANDEQTRGKSTRQKYVKITREIYSTVYEQ